MEAFLHDIRKRKCKNVLQTSQKIINEIRKVVIGKDLVVAKVFMAMLAKGHILIEDIPGVGKTTLALAFSRVLALDYKRVQFTPDTMPSDVTGFSVYNKQTGQFDYKPGAAMCNLFLADEINRTSTKTQAALLEVMEEGGVTVDGVTHPVPQPYTVIATQNPIGSAGTQLLPESQLDRFMICLKMGYPDLASEVNILKGRHNTDPLLNLTPIAAKEDIAAMQQAVANVHLTDSMYTYMVRLADATRHHPAVELGVSPRGTLALVSMAKAYAFLLGRDYVIPEDVQGVLFDTCAHRLILSPQARINHLAPQKILEKILAETPLPPIQQRRTT